MPEEKQDNKRKFFSKRKIIIICVIVISFLIYKEYRNGSIFLAFCSGMARGFYETFQESEKYSSENNTENDNADNSSVKQMEEYVKKIKNTPAEPPKESKDEKIIFQRASHAALSPFLRKLSSAELEILSKAAKNSSGNVSYKRVEKGCFEGYVQTTLKDKTGAAAVFVHKGADVYQFAFFPAPEKFADADESQRVEQLKEGFKLMFEKVYGEGEYDKNRDLTLENNFVTECSRAKLDDWVYRFSHGYAYACDQYGFAVMQDSVVFKHDLSPLMP